MSKRAIYYRDQAAKCRWHADRVTDAETQAELRKLAAEYIERAVEIDNGAPDVLHAHMRIKIRHRAIPPKPWKWENDNESKTVTGSEVGYANRDDAYSAAEQVLSNMVAQSAIK
jgi:hypothetical protein